MLRKKFSLANLIFILIFIAILFPIIGLMVDWVMHAALTDRAGALISELKGTDDADAMAEVLNSQGQFIVNELKLYFQMGILIVCVLLLVIIGIVYNFNRQRGEAEEILRKSEYKVIEMGKDFVANASHELRTPITIIRGFAETLQDLPEISQEMLAEITEKIVRTCIRLDKLVKSLLTLADIENLSKERMQEVNLVMLAENCQRILLTAHPNARVKLHSAEAVVLIHAEGDLIELAILNLLENALKYSQAPGQIELMIEPSGVEVQLKVIDRGIGISQSDLPHIFERFYTVNKARSRKLGGAGLGLSIVKTIIEKHSGRISVESELGKGTTFTIIFPAGDKNVWV
jgi:signal transduction histidine kinase